MFDVGRFFIWTLDNEAVIVPRRAFGSEEEWVEFVQSVRTRQDEEIAAKARAKKR